MGHASDCIVRKRAEQRHESEQVRVCGVPRVAAAQLLTFPGRRVGTCAVHLAHGLLCFREENFSKTPCCLSVQGDISLSFIGGK